MENVQNVHAVLASCFFYLLKVTIQGKVPQTRCMSQLHREAAAAADNIWCMPYHMNYRMLWHDNMPYAMMAYDIIRNGMIPYRITLYHFISCGIV